MLFKQPMVNCGPSQSVSDSDATMTNKIKLFQSVQKYNHTMGIRPHRPNQRWPLNITMNLIFLIGFAQMAVEAAAFLIYREKSTFEFGGSFYAVVTEACTSTFYLVQMWQITNISKLIKHFEEFIEKSK